VWIGGVKGFAKGAAPAPARETFGHLHPCAPLATRGTAGRGHPAHPRSPWRPYRGGGSALDEPVTALRGIGALVDPHIDRLPRRVTVERAGKGLRALGVAL